MDQRNDIEKKLQQVHKHQITKKLQRLKTKSQVIWVLDFGIYLVLVIWDLEFLFEYIELLNILYDKKTDLSHYGSGDHKRNHGAK